MIGPSSSHTAGAVKLAQLAALVWNRPVRKVEMHLRGSFAATWWGHGTDRALLAGLAGLPPDDSRVPMAREEATKRGIQWSFFTEDIDGAHPNSVRFRFIEEGKTMDVEGASIGGGAIQLVAIDGFRFDLSGELPSIITFHSDRPGVVAAITGALASSGVNIATLALHRQGRGKDAVMVAELDEPAPERVIEAIRSCHPGIHRVLAIDGGPGQ
ncbi:MAG: L-serine ammonia-lyase, iron-sulfur-dependent subunit beta [Thermovirgaceae bacterium]